MKKTTTKENLRKNKINRFKNNKKLFLDNFSNSFHLFFI